MSVRGASSDRRGTGVPPVNHVQDARATTKTQTEIEKENHHDQIRIQLRETHRAGRRPGNSFYLIDAPVGGNDTPDAGRRLQLERLSGPLGRYDGLALILVGLALIVVAAVRFVRTVRLLDDQEMHSAGSVRAELILSAVLALIVAGFTTYLVLG